MPELTMFGRYRIEAELGKGSSCTVYRAAEGASTVALKVLHRSLAADPVIAARFRREAGLSRELGHPGIVVVYDLVQDGEREALVMEYCAGGSLAAYQSDGASGASLDAGLAERWLRQLAEALDHAHARGWVHRGIKPENLLLDAEGRLKLADFGSARLQNLSGLTTSTTYLATPLYIAPEVMAGDPCRPAHDLYSVGAVFYRLLAGVPHRDTSLSALLAPVAGAYVPLAGHRPDLPRCLATLVDSLLGSVETRPGSARAILDALDGRAVPPARTQKLCLFCPASMPPDSPFCPACGSPDLYLQEYRGDDAEALVLTKLSENADTMERLYRFLRAWSGKAEVRYRFVTEDKRYYGKDELKNSLQLPYPLLNWLEPETAKRLVSALEVKGFAPLYLERRDARKVDKNSHKKSPLLRTDRPPEYRPAGTELLREYLRSEALPSPAGQPTAAPGSELSERRKAIVFEGQRLVDLMRDYGQAVLPEVHRMVAFCDRLLDQLATSGEALESVSLPLLYTEETRLNLRLRDEANLGAAEWQDLRRRLEQNQAAWKRYEHLEAGYAAGMHLFEELQYTLAGIVRDLNLALERHDPVAQSTALAACRELLAALERTEQSFSENSG